MGILSRESYFFEPVNIILKQLETATDFWNDGTLNCRWDIIIESLQELDRSGVFGEKDNRLKLTVNIMWGDQEPIALINSARLLNPPVISLQFARSQLDSLNRVRSQLDAIDSEFKLAALAEIDGTIDRVEEAIREINRKIV